MIFMTNYEYSGLTWDYWNISNENADPRAISATPELVAKGI
jgi:hypothetical protein